MAEKDHFQQATAVTLKDEMYVRNTWTIYIRKSAVGHCNKNVP